MSNLIKVINNKDRYFNGARKGGILEISKDRLSYYSQNGFSLVKEVEEKRNIVKQIIDTRTVKDLKQILDHNGVEYDKRVIKADLELLVKEVEEKKGETSKSDEYDIETLKTQLIEQAIVTIDELEGKSNDEITQIATDNGLI